MYSLVFYLALRFFKISAEFFEVLKIFSIILGLYVLTGIINFIHPWFNLSVIKFSFSNIYTPAFGGGQIISSILLVWLLFNLGSYFNLDRFAALLSGVLVFAVDRAFYFFAALLYFRSPFISGLAYRRVFWLGNYLSAVASLCLTFLFLWIGHTLNVKRKTTL
ncbi:MAG: hypothetical protein HZC16_02265 [Candidatus Omnitrophica bacterium]|nr:hypothetical protein [Candidatus Omnitrophota bacterium]